MKDGFFNKFKSRFRLKISGKNIERFIKRLCGNGIELLSIEYPRRNEVIIEIYKYDYDKVLELKSVYEVLLVDMNGSLKIRKLFLKNRLLIIGILFGLGILFFLSNIIYKVEIVHTNNEIRTLLLQELKERGVKEKSFKKSFYELEKIKEEIINEFRDKIEWMEIEVVGTKYVVRVEMRKIVTEEKEEGLQHIVASKGAIIRKVVASNGEILRNVNEYVNASDVVISGEIKLNDEVINYTRAEGKVYGEVWYKTTVSYPFYYYEKKMTGKKKKAFVFRFLNYEWEFSLEDGYQNKKVSDKSEVRHLFLPFSISFEEQEEVLIVEEMNTLEEAISKASSYAYQKMKSKLSDNEGIIDQKNLKVDIKNSKIVLEVFFTVLEDITSYQKIEPLVLEESTG